jgi:hypothetical protein
MHILDFISLKIVYISVYDLILFYTKETSGLSNFTTPALRFSPPYFSNACNSRLIYCTTSAKSVALFDEMANKFL